MPETTSRRALRRSTGTTARRALAVVVAVALLAGCQLVDLVTNKPVTKVLLFGDSMMWVAGPEIAKPFEAQGATVTYWGVAGTSPLWDDKQWLEWLEEALDTDQPDLVIFTSVGAYPGASYDLGGGQVYRNDLYVNDQGQAVEPDTPLMYTEWAKASQELVDLARSRGASTWWAIHPPALPASATYGATFPERSNRLRSLYATDVDVPTLDWGEAIAGQPTSAVYKADGIHLTDAGNQLVGPYTFNHSVRIGTPAP